MSVYVSIPNTIEKFSHLYEQTGFRRKRIHRDTFSEIEQLGKAATDNYIYGAASFTIVERLNSAEFKVSDNMIELIRHRNAYRGKLHDMVLSNPTYKAIIKHFGNTVPSHRKLSRFLLQDMGLGRAAAFATLNSFHATAHWLERQGLYDFDIEEFENRPPPKGKTNSNKDNKTVNVKRDDKPNEPNIQPERKSLEEELNDYDEDSEQDKEPRSSTGSTPKPNPIHALPRWVRAELEGIQNRIDYLKELIVRYETELPKLKEELWDLQRRQFELETGKY